MFNTAKPAPVAAGSELFSDSENFMGAMQDLSAQEESNLMGGGGYGKSKSKSKSKGKSKSKSKSYGCGCYH